MDMKSIMRYRDRCNVGNRIVTPEGFAEILEMYPYIVVTDKGTFSWVDIYMKASEVSESKVSI